MSAKWCRGAAYALENAENAENAEVTQTAVRKQNEPSILKRC